MGGIEQKNGCIFFYKNPAGYIEKDTARVDPLFRCEELLKWLEEQKLKAEWKEGVFERLSAGEKLQTDGDEVVLLKSCRIWQFKMDVNPRMKFIGYDELLKSFGEPDKDNYNIVYESEIETNNLEAIFTKFNVSHPQGFTGHSLSMSDVVELYDGIGSDYYYVDRIGFKEISFDDSQPEQGMKMEF